MEAIHTTSGKMLIKNSKTTYGKTNDTKVYFGYESFFDKYTNIYKLLTFKKYWFKNNCLDYPYKISVAVIHTRPMDMIHTDVVANYY